MIASWSTTISIRSFLTLSAIVYFLVIVLLTIFQRSFIFFPNGIYTPPSSVDLEETFKELTITTDDGISLTGWFHPPLPGKKTLLFFHGNADTISNSAPLAYPYIQAGYGFLVTEYRGYSGFHGSPTEEGLYADARAFVKGLQSYGVTIKDMVFLGHSLGSAVATQMAIENEGQASGLILLAPFLSTTEMAEIQFPFVPARLLVWDRFDNEKKIGNIGVPLFVAHGKKDSLVPITQGYNLYMLGREPKIFHEIPNSDHNDLFPAATSLALPWLDTL